MTTQDKFTKLTLAIMLTEAISDTYGRADLFEGMDEQFDKLSDKWFETAANYENLSVEGNDGKDSESQQKSLELMADLVKQIIKEEL